MNLNDAIDELEQCHNRPTIEVAWDQWTRTRIRCQHGVFEGSSDFMDADQGLGRAIQGFRDSVTRGLHYQCWADTPVPASWLDSGWSVGDVTECDLPRGHDGPHVVLPDFDAEKQYWRKNGVYYINGRDVTGKRDLP